MLYLVRMDVTPPRDMDPEAFSRIKAREKDYALGLQRDGRWRHIWRVVGQYSNYSIFDVAGNDELHQILQDLPLYPYMTIEVTPLATHPSDLAAQ
ncbi:muconolactone Delta-isomerase [Rhodoplanes sp. TEM]|uniref:Muconolactone Delta-isomerase n=1 Tax=Rhodoplanes tepidamans TaxID=200616 RepID=A0ABT5JFU6_RHOTP|nr:MULTISPECIES: muconolactone Delta-isomerase [Rhodoplanes]MDC7788211.1 muconolactone Delta-isomerase [Rhodoplanes tepidamans]MDC7983553.1 muconolactone Delta-isomerase [Rhodoplanes sp. TEM]MDQ0354204.1 muconolactone D-isomerase [Rhodoplanes tepidamans]